MARFFGIKCQLLIQGLARTARAFGDTLLLVLAIESGRSHWAPWPWVILWFLLPGVFLAPVIHGISSIHAPRRVLAGAVGCCLLGAALVVVWNDGWPAGVLVAGFGSALFNAALATVGPGPGPAAGVPFFRMNAWLGAASAAGTALGVWLGLAGRILVDGEVGRVTHLGTLGLIAGSNAVTLLALSVLPGRGRLDSPHGMLNAVRQFFGEVAVLFVGYRDTMLAAVSLALLWVLAGVAGLWVVDSWTRLLPIDRVTHGVTCIFAGACGGCLFAGVQGHPRRALALIPFGMLGVLAITAVGLWQRGTGSLLSAGFGLSLAVVWSALSSTFLYRWPFESPGKAVPFLRAAENLGIALVLVFRLATVDRNMPHTHAFPVIALALSAAGAIVACMLYYREMLEQLIEIILWPIYRIRARGPGVLSCPRRGPLLVIANHSAWFDPLWLAKVLPRRLYPMMTSVFYDLPVLRFLMTSVVHAIRVPTATFRRELPELPEAIKVLDAGNCLVIFAEGMMRRRKDQLLRKFGQGVWRILRERPSTPVVVCWIEGGWGSYMSYSGGPPTVKKRMDRWRRIDIALTEPQVLPPELLADHRSTRAYLWKACLAARSILDLPTAEQPEPEQADESNFEEPPDA